MRKWLRKPTIALGVILIALPLMALTCEPPNREGLTNGPPTGYTMIAEDEFNGTTLDTVHNAGTGDIGWRPNWFDDTGPTDPVNTYETACYLEDHVAVGSNGFFGDGKLTLSITDPGHTTYCPKPNVQGGDPNPNRPYLAGMVSSRGRFTVKPTAGHAVLIEVKAYVHCVNGVAVNWPAIWAVDELTGATGELDIMEVLDGDARAHWHGPNSAPDFGGVTATAEKCGWHTFAATWSTDTVTSYYDGFQKGTYTNATNVTETDQYLILGAQIGPEGMYGGPVEVPSLFGIDYVRVYQQ